MSEPEVTKEIQKFGYKLSDNPGDSDAYWYRDKNDKGVFFVISAEHGVTNKAIFIIEDAEEGKGIDEVLEKHREKYLALVGIDMHEHPAEPVGEVHRAIFFQNETYGGEIQINIRDGITSVTYGLRKWE